MDTIFLLRESIQRMYAKNSKIYEKAIQFLLAFVVFFVINHRFGFMKALTSPVISLGLAVICAFLPLNMTVIAGVILVLVHIFTFSPMLFGLTAAVFLIMYIFYLRLTPKMAIVVLLTPIAFALKIPYVIPVAFGLMYTPVCLVAILCGTVAFYMISYLKEVADVAQKGGMAGMVGQSSDYLKHVFQNKEMWIVIAALAVSFLVVYTLKRQGMDHAWKIGSAGGALAAIVVTVVGNIAMHVHIPYGRLILGNALAVVVGLVLEILFFAVDYTRSEKLEFEDDEYHYYVKAIPKLSMAAYGRSERKTVEEEETEENPREEQEEPKEETISPEGEIDKALIEESLKQDWGESS